MAKTGTWWEVLYVISSDSGHLSFLQRFEWSEVNLIPLKITKKINSFLNKEVPGCCLKNCSARLTAACRIKLGNVTISPTPPQVRGIVHTTVLEIHRRHTRISIFLKFNNIRLQNMMEELFSAIFFLYINEGPICNSSHYLSLDSSFVSNAWSKYPHYAYDLHLESNNYCRKGSLGSSFLHKSMKNIIMDGDWLAMTSCYPGSGKKISVKRFTKTRKATDYSSFKLTLTLLWPWVC